MATSFWISERALSPLGISVRGLKRAVWGFRGLKKRVGPRLERNPEVRFHSSDLGSKMRADQLQFRRLGTTMPRPFPDLVPPVTRRGLISQEVRRRGLRMRSRGFG
jgi:hypothetical protein